jgi:hypothetical protein
MWTIDKVIAECEQGEVGYFGLSRDVCKYLGVQPVEGVTQSTDRALQMLPKHYAIQLRYNCESEKKDTPYWNAQIWPFSNIQEEPARWSANGHTPALAICAALLKWRSCP